MSDMTIPDGKTCADCRHCIRCCGMFGAKPDNTECDFYPVRFAPKEPTNDN
jgi:hypothetical protein